ncbi:30202_t:CDS:2 [Gigaspora margarita]|uniref:30202_t:CDS:1 n=1 Tax=Gigaspora margarita TaxID=4874 RepID=A0ABN7WK44_GIGMA|nr:30202_t:CDS:2 [Gigaspora margarita]
MARRYPEDCSECNGFCLYARFARRELVLTSVHDEQSPQINEFESIHQHSHYVGPIQHPQIMNGLVQQPPIFNGPRHPYVYGPDQFLQHPCINGSNQLPQITEINNINNKNYILAEPNPQIQHHQAIRNYLIQPPLTPVQTNIQINNNLQKQPSFASQTSNVTVQPLQEFKNCNYLVCSILKNQCFQSIGAKPHENCIT